MPPTCSICRHGARQAIDESLVAGTPYRDVSKRFGVTPSALTRHRKAHLSPALVAVNAERERHGTDTVADRIEALYRKAAAILQRVDEAGATGQALAAIRELRSLCELLARITGELDERPQVAVVNLHTTPEWIELRTAILAALR